MLQIPESSLSANHLCRRLRAKGKHNNNDKLFGMSNPKIKTIMIADDAQNKNNLSSSFVQNSDFFKSNDTALAHLCS